MSSMQDLPGLAPLAPVSPPADAPARPRLRVVPDVPLDFDDAVRTLTPRLVRYATRRLGDVHEAEEVVQEALLRAYKHREELLTEDDLAAWSTCVTGRLVIDRLRVRGRSTSVAEVPEGTRVGRDTADVVVARDEARTALDALDAMPPRQAAVLWAREVEGLAYDEIGVRFGMTEPAVRSILTRARKALRKEYAARGGTLPAGGLAAIAPWADGLGWLERLRGALGRVTAPAALGVVTTGLLAGGLLAVPIIKPLTTAPATVATTVVTKTQPLSGTQSTDMPIPHGLGQAPSSPMATPPTTSGPSRGSHIIDLGQNLDDDLNYGGSDLTDPACLNSEVPPTGLPLGVPAQIGGPAGVGNSACDPTADKSRWEINSPIGDPAGTGLTGVEFWTSEECPDAAVSTPGAPASGPVAGTPIQYDANAINCTNHPEKDPS